MRFLGLVLCAVSFLASATVEIKKDPTRPTGKSILTGDGNSIATSNDLVIEAIFTRDNSQVAIINGVSVAVGEQHFGASILAINTDNVIIEQVIDGINQQRTISVNSTGEIKKNATNNF